MFLRLPFILVAAATFTLASAATLATVNGQSITTDDASEFMQKRSPG